MKVKMRGGEGLKCCRAVGGEERERVHNKYKSGAVQEMEVHIIKTNQAKV